MGPEPDQLRVLPFITDIGLGPATLSTIAITNVREIRSEFSTLSDRLFGITAMLQVGVALATAVLDIMD